MQGRVVYQAMRLHFKMLWGTSLQSSSHAKLASILSLPFQDDLDINIECVSEEKHPNRRVCNVSYPFFRAKAKVRGSEAHKTSTS